MTTPASKRLSTSRGARIIDLSTEIYDGMPVFPGDPAVKVGAIEDQIEGNAWYMKQITMCTHDGTHVNVPAHIKTSGSTLDAYTLDQFCGPAVRFSSSADFKAGTGVIFTADHAFTKELAQEAIKAKVAFVGLTNEFDLEVERYTLEHGLISFERLVHTELLPKEFIFYGIPLSIRGGDGSPVRAFAVVE